MTRLLIVFSALLFLASCAGPPLETEELYQPNDSVSEYIRSLVGMNLDSTLLGQAWIAAAVPGAELPGLTLVPFSEVRHFDATIPEAVYYLFEAIRGQEVRITLATTPTFGYFADILALSSDFDPTSPDEPWEILPGASAHFAQANPQAQEGNSTIVFEARNSRFFLLRVIPRLLEGGQIGVRVENRALAQVWPVENTNERQIWSYFGDSRDGGARVHHGVDIFAPRGTLIYAPVAGRITRVGERDLGGLSVSMIDDERGISYYFAHLDSYGEIRPGQQVEAGHIIGTVGNTGNAVTTPPHLHLGIYDRTWGSPVDPWYFLVDPFDGQGAGLPNSEQILQRWNRRNPHLPLGTKVRVSDLIESSITEVYRGVPARNPTTISPARRDARGNPLTPFDRPITRLGWNEGQTPETAFGGGDQNLRIVALRNDGVGLVNSEGILRWLPQNLVLGTSRM